MEALRLNGYVSENGLFIDSEKLQNFKNLNVEIIILPAVDKETMHNGNALNNLIGKLKNIPEDPVKFQRDLRNEW